MQERELVEQAMKGDRPAFGELVERHRRAVFGYIRARLISTSDAEDLVQEVFLRFYAGRAGFDTSNLVRPWLLGIARNILREYGRRNRRHKEIAWTELCIELEDDVDPEGGTYDDVLTHLPHCMEALGQSAREAIELKYRTGHRLSAIGEKLHRSEGAVKLLMFRARKALQHCLESRLKAEEGGHSPP